MRLTRSNISFEGAYTERTDERFGKSSADIARSQATAGARIGEQRE